MSLAPDAPIADLGLTTRAPGALRDAGITTIGQLLAQPRGDIAVLRGIGPMRMADLETALARHGLALDAGDLPPVDGGEAR